MTKTNYIIREDGIGEMISEEDSFIDTDEILEEYPYILKSIKEEGYFIENGLCNIFDEIVYENKVVGFAAFEILNFTTVVLNECYILPEFRGKRLFFNELCQMLFSAPNLGILHPTRDLVELLIDYSFARKVSDNIVISGIDFYFEEHEVSFKPNMPPVSNYYDLSICSTVYVDADDVIYHNPREEDIEKHSMQEINDDYLAKLISFFNKNQGEFEDIIDELKDELPRQKFGYDELIGPENELSEFMQEMVDSDIVSFDDAWEIKQQLSREFDAGEVDEDGLHERFTDIITNKLAEEGLFELFDSDGNSEGLTTIRDFFELIGDNEELGEGVINAILNDDEKEFERLIVNAMNDDEEFMENFLELADSGNDEEYLDLEALGLNMDSPHPIAEMMWGGDDGKYKLDDTFYGKDYPITYDNHIFVVLNSLKLGNNLDYALAISGVGGAMGAQGLLNMLHHTEFINDEVNYDNWDEFANEFLTVNELKDILRDNNLRVSGRKQELIDRIRENNVSLDEFKNPKPTVTENGESFIEDNKWIYFYNAILEKFNFNDFYKYLDEHDGDFIKLTVDYLEEHKKLAESENNKTYYLDCATALEFTKAFGARYLEDVGFKQ